MSPRSLLAAMTATTLLIGSDACSETIVPVDQDVMTSGFFTGTDLVRGYPGDSRSVHRVSTDQPFGTAGAETVYLTFDHDFAALAEPVAGATLRVESESGGFGADATDATPFVISAHGVTADPLSTIIDDTNAGGTTSWLDFLNDNILAAASAAHTTVTGFGVIEFDVTELVNSWIDGTNSVHAVALTGKDDISGNEFLHGISNNSETVGVSHSLTLVPEPAAALLLSLCGLLGCCTRWLR